MLTHRSHVSQASRPSVPDRRSIGRSMATHFNLLISLFRGYIPPRNFRVFAVYPPHRRRLEEGENSSLAVTWTNSSPLVPRSPHPCVGSADSWARPRTRSFSSQGRLEFRKTP
ncbi:hypothetical protein BHE74_00044127 [Ensete ventricosum]|nr:hypothetical protein BHE74_00044127 [Ensete ventricosum]